MPKRRLKSAMKDGRKASLPGGPVNRLKSRCEKLLRDHDAVNELELRQDSLQIERIAVQGWELILTDADPFEESGLD